VTAPMGKDARGREIVSAPVCADKCFHLHWRWGVDGVKINPEFVPHPERYYGWSSIPPFRSSAELGGPLIPPNQHLDVSVRRISEAEVEIRYRVRARDPGESQWQVLCEQGGAFAYNYQGVDPGQWPFLCRAILGRFETDSPANRRKVFMEVYSRLRWFDPALDGAARADIQQIPQPSSLPTAKWEELRDA
jgi:hypothetical protein